MIRDALRLKQAEFAKPLGVDGSYISILENDKKTPSTTLVSFLLQYYSVSKQWWETGEGEMFEKKQPDLVAELHESYQGLSPETRIIIDEMEKLSPEERRKKLRKFLADLDPI